MYLPVKHDQESATGYNRIRLPLNVMFPYIYNHVDDRNNYPAAGTISNDS